jgi:hypothetical protein
MGLVCKRTGVAGTRAAELEDAFRTRALTGAVSVEDGGANLPARSEAVTTPPAPHLVVVPCDETRPGVTTGWSGGLFRQALPADRLDRDTAYGALAAAVHHLLTRGLDDFAEDRLRLAAGVLSHVGDAVAGEAHYVCASHNVESLATAFQVWHYYRQLSRAVSTRHDLLVRMRARSNDLVFASLFNEEGRAILASHVRGFVGACARLGVRTQSVRRSEWIARVIEFRTDAGDWQVPPPTCLRLCADVVRETGDGLVLAAVRAAVLAAWNSLCVATNQLRDVFHARADVDAADRAALLAEIDERFAQLTNPGAADVVYFPGNYSLFDPPSIRRKRFFF